MSKPVVKAVLFLQIFIALILKVINKKKVFISASETESEIKVDC